MTIQIFYGFLLGIIGTSFGAWLAHFFSERRRRKEEFNKAAATFRAAFLPVLIFLKHDANIGNIGSTDDLSTVLQFGYIHRHLKALEVFKNHLSAQERADIDKVWKQYCYNKDNPEILFFEQYFTGIGSKSEKEAKKTLALERIADIIKFAKHK
jgi:hypothetical protein